MTRQQAALTLLQTTPGVVALTVFERHGIVPKSGVISQLREAGHRIESVHGLGYRLRRGETR